METMDPTKMPVTTTFRQCPACRTPMVVANGRIVTEHADVTMYGDPEHPDVTIHVPECRWHGKPAPSVYQVEMARQGL